MRSTPARLAVCFLAVVSLLATSARLAIQAGEPSTMGALAPSIESHLSQWVAAWKAVRPGFDMQLFHLIHFKSIGEEWSAGAYDPGRAYEDLRKKLYVMSPDRTRAIDPYTDVYFRLLDGRIVAGFADEQGVMVIDLTANRTMWVGQCDFSCGFHDAAWLSADRAVIAGYAIDFDDPNCSDSPLCKAIPNLLIYDFTRHSALLFQGPGVPGGPRHEYAIRRVREKLPNVPVY